MTTSSILSHNPRSVRRKPYSTTDSMVEAVKRNFNPFLYTERLTGCQLSRPDAGGYRKLLGGKLGGLTVREDGFYHHASATGGDVLDLVAFLRYGITCQYLNPAQFIAVLHEAAEWARIDIPGNRLGRIGHRQKPSFTGAARLLRPQPATSNKILAATAWRCTATYIYYDEQGTVLFYKDRLERSIKSEHNPEIWQSEKSFRQWHIGPCGERINNIQGVRRVLYNLPAVVSAIRRGWLVVIVEGEKDADRLNDLFRHELGTEAVATTSPGGAGHWLTSYSESLREAQVVIIGDADRVGYEHARHVAQSLHGVAAGVRIVPLNQFMHPNC